MKGTGSCRPKDKSITSRLRCLEASLGRPPRQVIGGVPSGGWEVPVGARGLWPPGTPRAAHFVSHLLSVPVTVLEGLLGWGHCPGLRESGSLTEGLPSHTTFDQSPVSKQHPQL